MTLPLASIVRDLFRLFFDKAVVEELVYEERGPPFASAQPTSSPVPEAPASP